MTKTKPKVDKQKINKKKIAEIEVVLSDAQELKPLSVKPFLQTEEYKAAVKACEVHAGMKKVLDDTVHHYCTRLLQVNSVVMEIVKQAPEIQAIWTSMKNDEKMEVVKVAGVQGEAATKMQLEPDEVRKKEIQDNYNLQLSQFSRDVRTVASSFLNYRNWMAGEYQIAQESLDIKEGKCLGEMKNIVLSCG